MILRHAPQATPKHNLLVLDHPYTLDADDNVPHFRAFSSALAKSVIEKLAARGESVDVIDLHADKFDPVMSASDLTHWRMGKPMNDQVADYQERMRIADEVFLVFPIWWEQMPGMMKGFADKVYAKNILYIQKGIIYKSLMKKGWELTVITVQGAPKPIYRFVFDNFIVRIVYSAIGFASGAKRFRHLGFTNVNKLPESKRFELLAHLKV